VPDSVLDELASDPQVRGAWNAEREAWSGVRGVPGTIGVLAVARDGVADAAPLTKPMPREDLTRQSAAPKASLTDILLAAGFCGFAASSLTARNRRAGGRPHRKRWSVVTG
jgi:hypothetical protein